MAETKITSAQTAGDIWTSTNLTEGMGIQIAPSGVSKEVTGFSSSNYIILPALNFSGTNTFDFTFHIKTGSQVTGGYYPVLSPTINRDYPTIEFISPNETSGKLCFNFLSSASSGTYLPTNALVANTEYWFKFGYDGSKFFLYEGTTADNMQLIQEQTATLSFEVNRTFELGIDTAWTTPIIWNGSIWITDLKIRKNGVAIFDGSTDEYTVIGSPTIIEHTIEDIYSISLQATGYDVTKTQVLENSKGTLTWVDDPAGLSMPSQTGQSGKFLTTNGTTASWDNIPTELPSQTGNSGKFLTTNGTTASWATVSDGSKWELANFSTSNYLYIGSMDFSNANSWSFLFHIKTGVLDSTTRGLLFGHKTQIYYPNIRFDLRSEKKMLFIIDGYQSDGFSIQSTELQSNTEYWFKLEYAGGTTYNLHQGTTYQNMEIVGAESSSYTLNNIEPVIGTYPTFFAVDGYWNGSIFISDFKIMKDNKLLFDGACVTPPYTINGALSFT